MTENSEIGSRLEVVPAKRLKVFITEEDRHDHRALFRAVLHLLHDRDIACATVFKGIEGFGERGVVHTTRNEVMSLNLPVTIEATDTPEKIDAVLPRLAALITSGLLEASHTSIVLPGSEESPATSPEGGNAC